MFRAEDNGRRKTATAWFLTLLQCRNLVQQRCQKRNRYAATEPTERMGKLFGPNNPWRAKVYSFKHVIYVIHVMVNVAVFIGFQLHYEHGHW